MPRNLVVLTGICLFTSGLFLSPSALRAKATNGVILPNASAFVQTANGGGAYSPTAGVITSLATPMRQTQFALKLIF